MLSYLLAIDAICIQVVRVNVVIYTQLSHMAKDKQPGVPFMLFAQC